MLESTIQLFLRERDQVSAVPIEVTENAEFPFFSPDGEWLGFFRGRALMKISLTGGAPRQVCEAELPSGASWGPDDTIVLAHLSAGVFTVPAAGGDPVP